MSARPELTNEPFLHRQENGHAVLLLHGLGGGIYELSHLGFHLHKQGHTVCGINYPGHDAPSARMPHSRWEEWYERAEKTCNELAQDHDSVSIVGFSTGSLVGLELTHNYPLLIDRLILLSPFLKVRHQWYFGLTAETYIKLLGDKALNVPRPTLPIRDREMLELANQTAYLKTFNIQSVKSAIELINRVKPKLSEITHPALIIQSPHDRVVCPTGAHYLMENLGSLEKELLWLEKSNHVVTLDVEREQVIERIIRFLENTRKPQGVSSV